MSPADDMLVTMSHLPPGPPPPTPYAPTTPSAPPTPFPPPFAPPAPGAAQDGPPDGRRVVLETHTDRPAVRSWHGRIIAIHGVGAAVLLALLPLIVVLSSGSGGLVAALSLSPFLILLANQFFQIGYHCYLWGARMGLEVPMAVTTDGLTFSTAEGVLRLPWPAVESLAVRSTAFGRLLTFRLVHDLQPDSPGVQSAVSPRTWTRVVRRGLVLGERGLCEDLDQVVGAVVSVTAGRVTVR